MKYKLAPLGVRLSVLIVPTALAIILALVERNW
jgi:hypothetical protein